LISLDQEFVADETPCPYNCLREGSVSARLSKAQVSNNVWNEKLRMKEQILELFVWKGVYKPQHGATTVNVRTNVTASVLMTVRILVLTFWLTLKATQYDVGLQQSYVFCDRWVGAHDLGQLDHWAGQVGLSLDPGQNRISQIVIMKCRSGDL
jgi:hypothetical protein